MRLVLKLSGIQKLFIYFKQGSDELQEWAIVEKKEEALDQNRIHDDEKLETKL